MEIILAAFVTLIIYDIIIMNNFKKNNGWDQIYSYMKKNVWIDKEEIIESKTEDDLKKIKLTRSIEL